MRFGRLRGKPFMLANVKDELPPLPLSEQVVVERGFVLIRSTFMVFGY